MKKYTRSCLIALACIASVDVAYAQVNNSATEDRVGSINRSQNQKGQQLNPDQKLMIFAGIRRSATDVKRPPSDFDVVVGAKVASSIELYALPDAVINDVPEAKQYKFTIFNDTVILVDPVSMQVAETIRQ